MKWIRTTLKEISTDVSYGYTTSAQFEECGPKFLRITDIVPYFVDYSTVPYCKIDENKFKQYQLEKGDLIIARTGATTGYNYLFEDDIDAVFASYLIRFRLNKMKVVPRLIKYILKSNDYYGFINNNISGAAQPGINALTLGNYSFLIPNKLEHQQKIARVLFNYDDLIENNNKRIKILEEIAQKIYKEWFVDFKFPAHETATFKQTELGKIPSDWEVSTLENVLSCIESGSRPKGGINPNDNEIPSIGAENILGLGKYDYSKEKYISNDFYEKMKKGKVKELDVLLYKDGAQLGRKSIFGENFPHSKCCINEHVFILRTNQKCSPYYLYFTLDTIQNTERIKQLNTNAAQPGINQEQVKGLTIVLPKKEYIEKFDNFVKPIVSNIFKLCIKNQTLKQTRDLLLPRLISGEIDVENLEIV